MKPEIPSSKEYLKALNELAKNWYSLSPDDQALEIAKLRYGKHIETSELMTEVDHLDVPLEERVEIKHILGLISLTDLPMTEDELLDLLAKDLTKAKRILDIAYAFRKTI